MNIFMFTVEEESLLHIFDTSSRTALVSEIRAALPDFDEPELLEIAENALRKLESMTDVEFAAIRLSPEFDLEGSEEDTEVIFS